MAISKIILNGVTQMDLTADTVAASNLIAPHTTHGADGGPDDGTDVPFNFADYTIYGARTGQADVVANSSHQVKIERLVTTA